MNKILIIDASLRDGFCKITADKIANHMRDKVQYELISVRTLNINQCKGCAVCLSIGSSKCPFKDDDTHVILEKLLWADGVIYIVPNYALSVPALLKNLFDRLSYVFHRPRLFHKVCLPVVVQGVYGGKKIIDYINEVMGFWGMNTLKGVVVSGGIFPKKEKDPQISLKDNQKIKVAIEKFLVQVSKAEVKSPSLFKLIIFRLTRNSMKYSNEVLPPDKAHFTKMGWLESDYYYDVKLNPFKKIIGYIFDRIAKRMMTN